MDNKKLTKEELLSVPLPENSDGFELEKREATEKKEASSNGQMSELKKSIEDMDLDDGASMQAAASAESLAEVEEGKRLKNLLELAKSKGVVFAVKVAQKMNDPYVLDLLHDKLAENGYYKEFLK